MGNSHGIDNDMKVVPTFDLRHILSPAEVFLEYSGTIVVGVTL
jgi:hypothetical protein